MRINVPAFTPTPLMLRIISRMHTFLYRISGGRFTYSLLGRGMLLLTTTGRKSGRRYTTPLQYFKDGDDIVIVGSNAGNERHADWWLNLLANPEAGVQVKRKTRRMRAEEVLGEDRERLWPRLVDWYPSYGKYQQRTGRRVPVVKLRPL
jgi:deazaflavin-dependent oxidoreductase (nitroreductase family)